MIRVASNQLQSKAAPLLSCHSRRSVRSISTPVRTSIEDLLPCMDDRVNSDRKVNHATASPTACRIFLYPSCAGIRSNSFRAIASLTSIVGTNTNTTTKTSYRQYNTTTAVRATANDTNDSLGTTSTLATSSSATTTGDNNTESMDVDAALNQILEDSQHEQLLSDVKVTEVDAWYTDASDAVNTAASSAIDWTPTWYNVADQAVVVVKWVHDTTGFEYGLSIIAATIAMRLFLFPVMIVSQRTGSRMAHLNPELTAMKKRYELLGAPTQQEQLQFSQTMAKLFTRHKVNPFYMILLPLIQTPLFLGMFFGLKKMPHMYADEFSVGGMLWFTDLTIPDPTYILPVISTATMLAMVEMSKEQSMATNPAQGKMMINIFRFMSISFFPFCVSFEASMLCYWTVNNILTLAQTGFLKLPAGRKCFGILEPPKPVPGADQAESLVEVVTKLKNQVLGKKVASEEDRIREHNDEINAKRNSIRMVREARAASARRRANKNNGNANELK